MPQHYLSQPRDANGRWTKGSTGSISERREREPHNEGEKNFLGIPESTVDKIETGLNIAEFALVTAYVLPRAHAVGKVYGKAIARGLAGRAGASTGFIKGIMNADL